MRFSLALCIIGVLLSAPRAEAIPITVSIAGSFTGWTESANWALPGLQTDPTFTGWITFDILETSPVNWVEVHFEVYTGPLHVLGVELLQRSFLWSPFGVGSPLTLWRGVLQRFPNDFTRPCAHQFRSDRMGWACHECERRV